jgi:hypothetical protein
MVSHSPPGYILQDRRRAVRFMIVHPAGSPGGCDRTDRPRVGANRPGRRPSPGGAAPRRTRCVGLLGEHPVRPRPTRWRHQLAPPLRRECRVLILWAALERVHDCIGHPIGMPSGRRGRSFVGVRYSRRPAKRPPTSLAPARLMTFAVKHLRAPDGPWRSTRVA